MSAVSSIRSKQVKPRFISANATENDCCVLHVSIMKPAPFNLFRPSNVDEALGCSKLTAMRPKFSPAARVSCR